MKRKTKTQKRVAEAARTIIEDAKNSPSGQRARALFEALREWHRTFATQESFGPVPKATDFKSALAAYRQHRQSEMRLFLSADLIFNPPVEPLPTPKKKRKCRK